MDVAIAVRVSKGDGGETGTVEVQQQYLEEFCRFRRYTIVETYIDDGVSGALPFAQREDGARLLRDVRRGKFQAVVVYKVDRVGRSVKVIYDFMAELDRYGVGFVSATQPIDTVSPFGKAMLGVIAVFAELERDMVIERLLDGRKHTARNGGHAGGVPPLGYFSARSEGDLFPTLGIDFTPIDGLGFSECDLIGKIYREFVSQNFSLVRLAEWLDSQGIPPSSLINYPRHCVSKKSLAGWSTSALYRILTNPIYKGEQVWGRTISKPGRADGSKAYVLRDEPLYRLDAPHLAIVPVDLWDLAQERLKQNARGSSRNSKQVYLLGNALIRCAACGYTYTGRDYGVGNGGRVYACGGRCNPRRNKTDRCPAPILKADPTEEKIWAQIVKFTQQPQEALQQLENRVGEVSDLAVTQRRMDELNSILIGLRAARGRVERLFVRGNLNEQQMDAELAELDREAEQVMLQQEGLKGSLSDSERVQRQMLAATGLLDELRKKIEGNPSPVQRQEIVRQAVERVTVREVEGRWKVLVDFIFGAGEEDAQGSTASHLWSAIQLTGPVSLVLDL
jgi:site-specific DNA recombinase